MPMTTIGDMSQHFLALRRNAGLKADVIRLGREVTTGVVADVTGHLGGDAGRLGHIDRRLALIDTQLSAGRETAQSLTRMQAVLDTVDSRRGTLSAALVGVPATASAEQQSDFAISARETFSSMVQALNSRIGDRSLFSGTATQATPLSRAEDMLDDIAAAVAGATTAAEVIDGVTAWFDDPTGGFATTGYLGDTGTAMTRSLDDGLSVTIAARADDPALRETLAAVAMAAVLDAGALAGAQSERSDLLRQSGGRLYAAAQPLHLVQARLGRAEAVIEESATRQSAERASLTISRNDLIGTDPFESASRLQEMRNQLELSYMVTARLSDLSLAEYMR